MKVMVYCVIYTSTAWSKVYAFDARTGALKWAFDPKVDGAKAFDACCDVVNRGVAVWKGRVYVGALDGRLIALDAASGELQWSTPLGGALPSGPVLGDDLVYVSSFDGNVHALEIASGEVKRSTAGTPIRRARTRC